MAGDRHRGRSRQGIKPSTRDILKTIESTDLYVGVDFSGDVFLNADNLKLCFGAAGATDSYIRFSSTNLEFYDSVTGLKTLADLVAATTLTLDEAFDFGKIIDGAETTSASSFQVGGTTTKLQIWDDGTDLNLNVTAGDMKLAAVGGDFDFSNDNITTTGIVSGGTVTDGTSSLTSGTLSVLSNISNAGAINIKPSGDADDYITFQTAADVPEITTTGTCDLKITASGGDISFDNENLLTTGTLGAGVTTVSSLVSQGITNTVGVIDTTAQMQIGADNIKFTIGASDDTDSYMYFDAAGNLTFFDSALGVEVTLSTLASTSFVDPTFTGDVTITDGKLTWTDAADEIAGVFTFSNVANDAIDIIANSATTGNLIHVASTSVTSGTGVRVDMDESILNLGLYFEAYDTNGAAIVWSVGEDGVTTLAGAAGGTDVLVLTAGDLQMTDGNIDMDEGKIEVNTTTNETSYIKKNVAGAAAVLEIENTEVTSTGSGLLIDQNATGNAIALEITHDGDLAAIDIVASAARTGNVINIPMANMLAETAIDITGAATGTAGEGIVHLDITGACAGNPIRVDSTGANLATGNLMVLSSTGAQAAPTEGICAFFEDTGAAAATSYAVSIASTSNEALHVSAGETVIDEKFSVNDDVLITIADNKGVDALTIDQNDVTQDKDGLVITVTGDGSPIKATCETATSAGNLLIAAANQSTALLTVDGDTNGWLGADALGQVHITNDIAGGHANASMLLIDKSAAIAEVNDARGSCLRIMEDMNVSGSAPAYAVYIHSDNNEAMLVDKGTVVVTETLTASGGIITKHSDANITIPPTDAELAGTFAFTTQGQIGTIDDNNAATQCYFVMFDGANYWYVAGTKAV